MRYPIVSNQKWGEKKSSDCLAFSQRIFILLRGLKMLATWKNNWSKMWA